MQKSILFIFVIISICLTSCGIDTKKDKLLNALETQYRPYCPMNEEFINYYLNNDTLILNYECESIKVVGLDSLNLDLLR